MSAPCSAAARACTMSSWMLPVATIRYSQGRGRFAAGGDARGARRALRGDVRAHTLGHGVGHRARLLRVRGPLDHQPPLGHGLGNLLRGKTVRGHRPGDQRRGTVRQQATLAQVLDHAVGQRHLVLVDSVDAHQAQRGAFDGGRRLAREESSCTWHAMRRADSRARAMRAWSSCNWGHVVGPGSGLRAPRRSPPVRGRPHAQRPTARWHRDARPMARRGWWSHPPGGWPATPPGAPRAAPAKPVRRHR
jgi:hypothetical protein